MNTQTKNNNLFPLSHLNRTGFTEEELQDILRYADEHGIHGTAKAKLVTLIRDLRAAHAVHPHHDEKANA